MEEVKFVFHAMIQRIKDEATLKILRAFAPNRHEADKIVNALRVFIRNGVSIETAIKITAELGEALGTNTNKE